MAERAERRGRRRLLALAIVLALATGGAAATALWTRVQLAGGYQLVPPQDPAEQERYIEMIDSLSRVSWTLAELVGPLLCATVLAATALLVLLSRDWTRRRAERNAV